jgi:predicted TIM-barrel fold metal-dependent hydrolase
MLFSLIGQRASCRPPPGAGGDGSREAVVFPEMGSDARDSRTLTSAAVPAAASAAGQWMVAIVSDAVNTPSRAAANARSARSARSIRKDLTGRPSREGGGDARRQLVELRLHGLHLGVQFGHLLAEDVDDLVPLVELFA